MPLERAELWNAITDTYKSLKNQSLSSIERQKLLEKLAELEAMNTEPVEIVGIAKSQAI